MHLPQRRHRSPRLYRLVDDPNYTYARPRDRERRRILDNMVIDCRTWSRRRPWRAIPRRPKSPHPFHQLYITFYAGMQATALIELYAFTWRFTGEPRWLARARTWLLAAARWEHGDAVEEHFYTANRYMQAFAVALDLLADELSHSETAEVTDCLVGLMERWWPDVEAQRHSAAAGHHPAVDNGHFGVAALHLLGRHPEAGDWVAAVVDRCRAALMPSGCGPRGEPLDGGHFWTWENLWLLHFCDALRHVTGLDLYREFPRRLIRPLDWFRHHLLPGEQSLSAGARPMWSPVLLRLAQEAGDTDLRDAALADPDLGRMYSYCAGVKGSSAECIIAHGPYALLYCDPAFEPRQTRPRLHLARTFTEGARRHAVLRSTSEGDALIAHVSGYDGRVAHGYGDLQVAWRDTPALQSIACLESRPVACGAVPRLGGQSQWLLETGPVRGLPEGSRLKARGERVDVEYLMLHNDLPVLLVAARRRPRGVRLMREAGSPRSGAGRRGAAATGCTAFARLDGRDYLQYPREKHFNPASGSLRLRFRLREDLDADRPQVLWGVGVGVPGLLGPQVNGFALGFFGGSGLVFAVQSQRYTQVEARIPPAAAQVVQGQWHDVVASWGGLNDPRGRPFIALSLDGVERHFDDTAVFGELDRDSQNLKSRSGSAAGGRVFYVHPNTEMAFGAAIQAPDTGVACDLARIDLSCPGRQPLTVDLGADGPRGDSLAGETGSGELAWLLHPRDLHALHLKTRHLKARHSHSRPRTGARAHALCAARLGSGRAAVDVQVASPHTFRRELVPHAPSGLAAGSLKQLGDPPPGEYTRLVASAGDLDHLVVAFAPAAARLRLEARDGTVSVRTKAGTHHFALAPRRGDILVSQT